MSRTDLRAMRPLSDVVRPIRNPCAESCIFLLLKRACVDSEDCLQTLHLFVHLADLPLLLKEAMPERRSTESLVWIDCEMTGLDSEQDTIMSLACFITDYELNLLDEEGYEAVIHHSQDQLNAMGDWCRKHHGESGLSAACLTSSTTAQQAADGLTAYVTSQVPSRRRALLAGNSVHADRMFLAKEPWAQLLGHLHHRIFDVSSIKEAARRWSDEDLLKGSPQKAGKHEAKADILESIEEAKYYRTRIFQRIN